MLCSQRADAQSRPLTCFCLATPKGTHFLKAVESGEGTHFLSEQLAKVLEDVGPEHIVAVFMDGAWDRESANRFLER